MIKNENGRSMIEMLGVLAIIGVLSVGGIYGYTTAMKKYKANEVAQTISMLATLSHAANGGYGGQVTLANSGLELSPGGVNLSGASISANCQSGSTDCAIVEVNLSSWTADAEVKKGVCSIVPKDGDAAIRAGYKVTGCTS